MFKGRVPKEVNELDFGTAALESSVSYLGKSFPENCRGVSCRQLKGR